MRSWIRSSSGAPRSETGSPATVRNFRDSPALPGRLGRPLCYGRNIRATVPHRVAVLALPGVLPIGLGIPTQIFNPRPSTPYRLTACGAARGSVTTSTGFTVGATAGLSAPARADTIIVPGYDGYLRPPAPEITAALRRAFRRGARIASIIAARSGLGSGTNLRARFRDAVGTTPTAYRRAFREPRAAA
ncbi:hypothetical protein ACFY6U_45145 [Streptomyces sp. NPDC013157]|uniref:hypothetical protein n=1 Tax=Streptomyces sp. NPDC013157 TaxID=3364861 RepID=UPI00367B4D21